MRFICKILVCFILISSGNRLFAADLNPFIAHVLAKEIFGAYKLEFKKAGFKYIYIGIGNEEKLYKLHPNGSVSSVNKDKDKSDKKVVKAMVTFNDTDKDCHTGNFYIKDSFFSGYFKACRNGNDKHFTVTFSYDIKPDN